MNDIQNFCKFFNDLPEDDFSGQSWSSWSQHPTTRCFIDYILKSRLETMKDAMSESNVKDLNSFFYSRGRYEAFGELVGLISDLKEIKEEEK